MLNELIHNALMRRPTADGQLFVITDSNVDSLVIDRLHLMEGALKGARKIVVPAGEEHKNLESAVKIWSFLSDNGATRGALAVNIGGGMVTDLGGFAASTFKRGIDFINVPTTLLGAVDAAIGGKTGVNRGYLKNEIGTFAMPLDVLMSGEPFGTLPREEVLSGMGEMLKTALVADATLYNRLIRWERLVENPGGCVNRIRRCAEIKREITCSDPKEKGLRKVLNFGHTAGHAFESICLERGAAVPHGIAVAHGIMFGLIVSHIMLGMPTEIIYPYEGVLKSAYPRLPLKCGDADKVVAFMGHDKKNAAARHPSFVLLRTVGEPVIDCEPAEQDIRAAFDIYMTEIN